MYMHVCELICVCVYCVCLCMYVWEGQRTALRNLTSLYTR